MTTYIVTGLSLIHILGHEFEAVQDEVPADAVVLFQKAHHLVDDGLFLFLLCGGFAGLVGIDVGIVQGLSLIHI